MLIEVNCETDFVARTEEFQKLVRDLAVQVAGLAPLYVDQERIPAADLEAKQAELAADESVQKKPENIRPQIVEGQLKKWYSQVCLYDQPFRDEERTVGDLINEKIATIGENIRVRCFTRYALGEELERHGDRPGRRGSVGPYRRILLKLSGEALLGERQYGVDPEVCVFIARQSRRSIASASRSASSSVAATSSGAWPRRPAGWTARPVTTSGCSPRS